jgi:methionine synthase II (cobalamin-independent)
MPVFTDGEVRRENWMDGLLASIGGVVGVARAHVDWHRDGGTPPADETDFDGRRERGRDPAGPSHRRRGRVPGPARSRPVQDHNDQLVHGRADLGPRSAWMARGSYEPIAERLFGEMGVDRFLLEYDTERAGGFEPLRFIRPGTTVVLGLVSSKVPRLESQDELRRRIDEAAAYVPLEDLALSLQCGFASTSRGNLLTIDEERRKLALVADTAAKVWG